MYKQFFVIFPGFTPLMYACESGNVDCVKVLLENGASVKCSVSIENSYAGS